MGYLADGLAEFWIAAGHRHAAEYYLAEFIRALSEKDCADLIELDSKLAIASGAFKHKKQYERFRSRAVVDSYDFSVIGNLMAEVIICDISGGSDLMDEFLNRLDPRLAQPDYCATVIAKRLFHQLQTQQFLDEIENLLAEAKQADKGGAEDEEDEQIAPIAIDSLQAFLSKTLPLDWEVYDHMLERSRVQQRHSFVATEYTLCLDDKEMRQLVKPIEILIAESARNPKLLFKIEPRTLEQLVAEIFKSFGYAVELTARTKDGGRILSVYHKPTVFLSSLRSK